MTDRPIKVLLVEDNPGDGRLIQEFLGEARDVAFDLVRADRLSAALTRLQRGGIDLVLLDLLLPDSEGLETFRQVQAHAPGVPIVILSGVQDDTLAMQAVREGAQDYLVKGIVKGHSLVRVIRYTIERHRARNGLPDRPAAGRAVGFIGAKGGVGTTTVALNVAAAMVKQGHSVIGAELGPGWGTFSAFLNLTPSTTLAAIRALPAERIDAQALAPLLYKDPDGLQMLFGPQQVEELEELDSAKAAAVVGGLVRLAEYTVLDLPASPSRTTAAIIPHCHHVVLVTTRDPLALASGRRMLELLKTWGAQPERVSAVLVTRTPLTAPVDTAELGAQLSCDVLVVVPSALDACAKAQKLGVPLVIAEPGLPASARLMQLAEWLVQRPATIKAR